MDKRDDELLRSLKEERVLFLARLRRYEEAFTEINRIIQQYPADIPASLAVTQISNLVTAMQKL